MKPQRRRVLKQESDSDLKNLTNDQVARFQQPQASIEVLYKRQGNYNSNKLIIGRIFGYRNIPTGNLLIEIIAEGVQNLTMSFDNYIKFLIVFNLKKFYHSQLISFYLVFETYFSEPF